MAARRSRKGRRRNRGRFGGLYKLLSILLILAAIVLGCVVFFRVNTMLVEGNSRYTAEEVIAASGVQQGDNLFALNKSHMISQILTRLPYVDDLSIQRKLPDTLVFYVTESVPVAWVESGGTCWLLDHRCKILEAGDSSLTENLPQVMGLTPLDPSVGGRLTVAPEEQNKLDRLREFFTAIGEMQMTGSLTGFVDLSSENEIRFGYGADLTVIFPLNGDFDQETYELKRALESMDERGIARSGTLDQNYEGRVTHLLPDRWLPGQPDPTPEGEGGGETEPPAASESPQGENNADE